MSDDANKQQYKLLVEDMIKQLNSVLDKHVVSNRLQQVKGLVLSEDGEVNAFQDDPQVVVQRVVDSFLLLSNEVVAKTLQPLLKQCPWIKIPKLYAG